MLGKSDKSTDAARFADVEETVSLLEGGLCICLLKSQICLMTNDTAK